MKIAVRRRGVLVEPADDADVRWILEQFDREDTWKTFGYDGPAMGRAMWIYLEQQLILGVIKRGHERLGFCVLFPPQAGGKAWEFGYVVTERRARDAFTALHAVDAISHYLFDLIKVEAVSFRVRDENKASLAVISRLGYRPFKAIESKEGKFHYFEVDQAKWAERRAMLFAKAGEPVFFALIDGQKTRWRPVETKAA